jgi:hypothetical protein
MTIEFICIDCEARVYDAGTDVVPSPARCSVCGWIASIPEPGEREAVRSALLRRGVIPVTISATP